MPLPVSFSPAFNSRITVSYQRAARKVPLFSTEECKAVISWATTKSFTAVNEPGKGASQYKLLRCGREAWNPRVLAFQQKLEAIVEDLNHEIWRFDITEFLNVDILRYEVGDRVPLHVDLGINTYDVKLGVFVQLSPGNAYKGGTLRYGGAPPLEAASRAQGALLILPAWVPHHVTTVTAGTRYSAVCWAVGPSFR